MNDTQKRINREVAREERRQWPSIGEVVAEASRVERATAEAAGLVRKGVARDFHKGPWPMFLYVTTGGPRILEIRYITADWWINTDGNGGFGQSWCCCPGTPIYGRP